MLLFRLCMSRTILLLVPSTRALYLADPPASINTPQASPPANDIELVNVSSTTNVSATTSLNSSGVGAYSNPVCDGNLLGFDMSRHSCYEAWNTIPSHNRIISFGKTSAGDIEVYIPRRFSSPDGTCVIDIFLRDGFASDVASFSEISRAAKTLDNACVARVGVRVQGGWIRDIGRDKNLALALSRYEPAVSCFGAHFSIRDPVGITQRLLSTIPISHARQIFGRRGDPGVEVVMPKTYHARFHESHGQFSLRATVDVKKGKNASGRWVDVWAAAVAVTSLCTARGYAGTSSMPRGFIVTVDIGSKGLGSENETATS
ncbi:hypothetical protein BDR22DRAFT_962541 [Usnea florida]